MTGWVVISVKSSVEMVILVIMTEAEDVQTDVKDSSWEETFTLIHWCSTLRWKQTHVGLRQPDKVMHELIWRR